MYCARCGVELQKGVSACPLCGTRVYHPEIQEKPEALPYPRYAEDETVSRSGALFLVTFLFLLPLCLCLVIDLKMHGAVTWSGYVSGGLAALYFCFCLPFWFQRPNPVIFFPVAVAALSLLSLYICLKTGGHWYLPFALPLTGLLLLLTEPVIVLLRYTVGPQRHRALYILGAAIMALGLSMVLLEFLLKLAFGIPMRWWSLYPLTALVLIGLLLFITGLNKPLRDSMHKRFFI